MTERGRATREQVRQAFEARMAYLEQMVFVFSRAAFFAQYAEKVLAPAVAS